MLCPYFRIGDKILQLTVVPEFYDRGQDTAGRSTYDMLCSYFRI